MLFGSRYYTRKECREQKQVSVPFGIDSRTQLFGFKAGLLESSPYGSLGCVIDKADISSVALLEAFKQSCHIF